MVAIAFLAASFGLIRLNADSPAHRYHTDLLVDFPATPIPGPDEDPLALQDWQARLGELTSPAVLDAALDDGHLSTLPRLYRAENPRAEFRRMLQVQGDHRIGVVRIRIDGYIPAEPFLAARRLAEAILTKGPRGARVTRPSGAMRMPLAPVSLDQKWKIAAALFAVVLGTTAILSFPWPVTRRCGSGFGLTRTDTDPFVRKQVPPVQPDAGGLEPGSDRTRRTTESGSTARPTPKTS